MRKIRRNLFLAVLVLVFLVVGGCKGTDYNWGWYEILPSTEKGAGNLKFLFGVYSIQNFLICEPSV